MQCKNVFSHSVIHSGVQIPGGPTARVPACQEHSPSLVCSAARPQRELAPPDWMPQGSGSCGLHEDPLLSAV